MTMSLIECISLLLPKAGMCLAGLSVDTIYQTIWFSKRYLQEENTNLSKKQILRKEMKKLEDNIRLDCGQNQKIAGAVKGGITFCQSLQEMKLKIVAQVKSRDLDCRMTSLVF